ncbi:hypothetical protein C0Q70_09593 [Pomacea canaliculata]|uniref:Saccharopine dehydrogenase-like C-terminal domain-containing protein n=1 Tax=Pomacea canaliculata TaxID=400727 RepID=A0A2T7PA89_POMCA|nr:hypothetical protein C0Q70_09593 [Pomacea canaliculata]
MAVLILGAGRVSGPVFEYFHKKGIPFSVVSAIQKELNAVKSRYASAQCYNLNLPKDVAQLPSLIAQHKVVLDILPAGLLPLVAHTCLEVRCSMVSCNDVPEEIQELHHRVVDVGITFLCECGLDPGIDHMLAKQAVQDVKDRGGQVTSFTSWCGGLPAPECSNNVLKYKFRLGLLSDTKVDKRGTPIDTLCHYLLQKLNYAPGERDMVIMVHELQSEFPQQSDSAQQQQEVTTVSLLEYGDIDGHSAMAKTVGYPSALAVEMILNGEIHTKGVIIPTMEDVYKPVLSRLQQLGIVAKVSTSLK